MYSIQELDGSVAIAATRSYSNNKQEKENFF